jgi:hypothetical protein
VLSVVPVETGIAGIVSIGVAGVTGVTVSTGVVGTTGLVFGAIPGTVQLVRREIDARRASGATRDFLIFLSL